MFCISEKSKAVRVALLKWNQGTFKSRLIAIEEVRDRLGFNLAHPFTDVILAERATLLSKLDELLSHEEVFWRQHLRVLWLKDGDRNSKFFHQSANARKAKNRIVKLQDDQGK